MHPVPDPHPPVKNPKLILAAILLSSFASLFSALNQPQPQPTQLTQAPTPTSTPQVLGDRTSIYVTPDTGYGYGRYSLISLPSSSPPQIKVGANQSGTIFLKLYRISKDQLLEFLIHDDQDNQTNSQLDTASLTEITTTQVEAADSYRADTTVSLPLEDSGIYYLTATLEDQTRTTVIVRSQTGFVAKEGNDELIFWAQDFTTKKSTSADVKVYSLQDQVSQIAQTTLSDQGLGTTSISDAADIALLDRDGDIAITPLNLSHLDYSFGGYERFAPKQDQYRYFSFTDKPIYQPGDTIYFKSILRQDDDARYYIPSGQVRVKIAAGYGDDNTVFDQLLTITSNGDIDGQFTLPQDSPTGYYHLTIQHLQDQTPNYWYSFNRGYVSFQVEHYRKPEYFLSVDTHDSQYIGSQTAQVQVKGQYFSGQPLNQVTVKYTIDYGSHYQHQFLRDFQKRGLDSWRYRSTSDTAFTGEVTLDENGEGIIEFDTKANPEINQLRVYTIRAYYQDSTGNPVEDSGNVLVYPASFDIFRTGSYQRYAPGDTVSIPLTLHPHKQTQLSNIDITANITHTEWIKTYSPDKKYPTYTERKTSLPTQTVTTDQSGNAILTFPAEKSGSYSIVLDATDEFGDRTQKTISQWVYSQQYPAYSGSHQGQLTITTDQQLYQYTDTARLLIESTIPDTDILLTLDRGRVNRYQVVSLTDSLTTVSLPLEESDMPNIFAYVTTFGDEQIQITSANLKVSTDPKQLLVTTATDKSTYGPGEDITVTINTTDYDQNPVPANVTLWTVDKSLFQLAKSQLGDIFDTFWKERYHQTQSSHSLAGIYSNPAEGGGCFAPDTQILMADGSTQPISQVRIGDQILTKSSPASSTLIKSKVTDTISHVVDGYFIINGHLKVTPEHILRLNGVWQPISQAQIGDTLLNSQNQPVAIDSIEWQAGQFKVYNLTIQNQHSYFANNIWVHNQKGGTARAVFKDTAYWNPNVQTDQNGQAQLTFTLPDNLTTWVISAVGANTSTQVGQTETEIQVQKGLVIRPVVPNLLRVDDHIQLAALVHNHTDSDQEFGIQLDFPDGQVNSTNPITLTIPAHSFDQVTWDAIPQTPNPASELTFTMYQTNDQTQGDKIVQTLPVETVGYWFKHAQVATDSHQFSLNLDPSIDLDQSSAYLSLSASLTGSLPPAADYLLRYPYGCTEQTTSRFIPALTAKEHPELFKAFMEERDIDEYINTGIARLTKLQQSDGGWSWWGRGESDYYVTSYVLTSLIQAQDLGFDVPDSLIVSAREFLQSSYAKTDLTPAQTVASRYGLSLFDDPSGSFRINQLTDLDPDVLALAVLTNQRQGLTDPADNGLNQLIAQAQTQGESVYWEAGNLHRFGSAHASTALAIRALLAQGDQTDLVTKAARFLTRTRVHRYWSNTYSTAQVIQAAAQFAQQIEASPDFDYTITLDDSQLSNGQVTDPLAEITRQDLPLADITPESILSVTKSPGAGQLYSTLYIEEFLTDTNASARSNTITLSRQYQNDKGPNYNIAVGDTVKVHLTVEGLNQPDYYLIIDDQLPSGLIPINLNLDNERATAKAEDEATYYRNQHIEYQPDGVHLSAYQVKPGQNTFTYRARVVNAGTFTAPPASAALMYSPEIYALSDAQTLQVDTESKSSSPNILQPTDNKQKLTLILIGFFVISILVLTTTTIIVRRTNKKQSKEDSSSKTKK